MKITEVKIFPVDDEKLKAYVTITLEGCFVVRDLKIIKGVQGLFVAMPSKKRKDGTYKDIAHPLDAETRRMFEEKIVEKYREHLETEGRAVDEGDLRKITEGGPEGSSDDDH